MNQAGAALETEILNPDITDEEPMPGDDGKAG